MLNTKLNQYSYNISVSKPSNKKNKKVSFEGKIALMTMSQAEKSNLQIAKKLVEKGHEVIELSLNNVICGIKGKKSFILHNKKPLPKIDAVITRFAIFSEQMETFMQSLKNINPSVICINEPQAIINADNKWMTHLALAKLGIPQPTTIQLINNFRELKKLPQIIDIFAGNKITLKNNGLRGGEGVFFIAKDANLITKYIIKNTNFTSKMKKILEMKDKIPKDIKNYFENIPIGNDKKSLFDYQKPFLIQEFINTGNPPRDIRAFVIGDEVVASMQRSAKKGEYRANLHKGGKGEIIQLTDEEKELAIKSAKALDLKVAGIDILRQNNTNPIILEVNHNPGLQISDITGVDLISKIVDFLDKQLKMLK